MRTQEDFRAEFVAALGERALRCRSFALLAVEMLLLERARDVVYSDNSNIGRYVALRRTELNYLGMPLHPPHDEVRRMLFSLSVQQRSRYYARDVPAHVHVLTRVALLEHIERRPLPPAWGTQRRLDNGSALSRAVGLHTMLRGRLNAASCRPLGLASTRESPRANLSAAQPPPRWCQVLAGTLPLQ